MGFVDNNKKQQILLNTIMIILVLCCVLPFLLLFISSFTSEDSLVQYGYSFFPREWSLETYQYLWNNIHTIGRGYFMTFFITFLGTVGSVCLTILFAYPLSRPDLPYRNFISFFVFFTMLFNGGLVPTYLMYVNTFHIKNTIWGLIIPSLFMNAFYVIMMRSYFTGNISDSLIEAARLDGAGEMKILVEVVVPLSKPMIATLALMIGLGYWNDWTNGMYYITDSSLFTIQNILNNMLTNIQFLASSSSITGGASIADLPSVGIRMAIAVIAVFPVLCIYPFFQKSLIKGIAIGGVKG